MGHASGILLLLASMFLVTITPDAFAIEKNEISTGHYWKINSDEKFKINLIDNKYVTPERIESIKEVIFSEEQMILPDILINKGSQDQVSTFYLGWLGALNSIENTKNQIPKNFILDVTKRHDAEITIELSNMQHPEKFAAYTNPMIVDGNMIKNAITIYDIQSLKADQMKILLRHEMGHGFGIEHSTNPEDLMFQEITTSFPYISPCVLEGLEFLYNGNSESQITCKK